MRKWSLKEVAALFEECGAMALEKSKHLTTQFKSDRSIVTDADKAIEALLAKEFDRPAEGSWLIGEETSSSKSQDYIAAAMKGPTWIVDPIDGTAPFAHGIPLWGISIGYMVDGVIQDGAIFLPPMGEMIGSEGGVAFRADAGMGLQRNWGLASRLAPMKPPHVDFDDGGILNISQRMARAGTIRMPNPVHSLCSCVYSSAALMTGKHMAYIFSAKVWDMAGSLPALKALGFSARLHSGPSLMDLRVTPEIYELDMAAKSPWHIRGHAIVAVNDEIVEKVVSCCSFP